VTEEVDGGPIVVQKRAPVLPGDTPESLKARVQPLEGPAFIEAIEMFAAGRLGPPAPGAAGAQPPPLTYKAAGVDISAGNDLVDLIKPLCRATARPGCDAHLGGFGGMFDLAASGYDAADCVLVSGTDGVGTKLRIAHLTGAHGSIGIDLVAMCVNDVIVAGAEPLFFLDYFACGRLDVQDAASVVSGIAEGCKLSNCGLVGGETAEMPSMYKDGDYDVAGFAVGAVQRQAILPRGVAEGDLLLGLASSGVHSNGFSLVRKVVERAGAAYGDPCPWAGEEGKSLGEALLTPTRIYVAALLPLIKRGLLRGMAHITGGGLTENLPRVLPDGLSAEVDLRAAGWALPPVFAWLRDNAGLSQDEMLRTFNCGVGMVLVVSPDRCEEVLERLAAGGEATVLRLGRLRARQGREPQVQVRGEW